VADQHSFLKYEEAAVFVETALFKNSERVKHAKKYGVPDSWWLKCLVSGSIYNPRNHSKSRKG